MKDTAFERRGDSHIAIHEHPGYIRDVAGAICYDHAVRSTGMKVCRYCHSICLDADLFCRTCGGAGFDPIVDEMPWE